MMELYTNEKKIKAIEEEHEKEKARVDLWLKMIEIAEVRANLDIRKRFDNLQTAI